MIDFHFSPTPNGLKVKLFFAESGLPHRARPMKLSAGDQYAPAFLAISPNNKMPAIVDHEPVGGGDPLPVFESGAILIYLADKCGRFVPGDPRLRLEALQWLFWQVGGLGPMAGQAGYFRVYASEPQPLAIERYTKELARLYGVLDRRLAEREWIVGDEYSIVDMACYPWVVPHAPHGQSLADFPSLRAWFDRVAARPATVRAYEGVEDVYAQPAKLDAAARRLLYR